MKKVSLQTLVALAAGVILLLSGPLTASALTTVTGTHTFDFWDVLDVPPNPSEPPGDGVFHVTGDLLVDGIITCNDTSTVDACPIKIEVTGNMIMKAGAKILAENNAGGGNGGDITITVGGNLILCGTPGTADPLCGGAGSPGALISSSKTSGAGDTGQAGVITINVVGDSVVQEPGSVIKANGTGPAGEIKITGGKEIDINGSVLSQGGPSTLGLGGPISIIAKCTLDITDGGIVSSRGRDPGADLVHLEAGCNVTVFGLVESTGPGHKIPPLATNKCHPAGKPANSTACVEVWAGQDIVIDSTGTTHKGELNADTGQSGGTNGFGWIDVFARHDISIIDGAGNDHVGGTIHALHANQYLGNGHGGLVEVRAEKGKVSTSGNAIQANDTAAGGQGGKVDVEAGGLNSPVGAGDVAFDSASIQAKGATSGGGSQKGGTIFAQSFHGQVTGTASPGSELNAGGGGPLGTVTLTACIGNPLNTYAGTVTGTEFDNAGVCSLSDTPVIPALVPHCNCQGCPT
jgi:hypothetical protein